MKFTKTSIEGLVIIDPAIFGDHRGHFLESYNEKEFKEVISKVCFVQDNESKSSKGVLRGLHFQKPPFAQAKLVRCIEGKVLDVAVDIRKNSKTYGQHFTTELSGKNKKQVFIPRGFAHGFVVISEFAILSYKVDNYYKPEFESGIIWNDPDLNIDWRINKSEIVVSEKDTKLQPFNNFVTPF
jgi:dTDP-4-dehydrorhamnose 3,5-epimerase